MIEADHGVAPGWNQHFTGVVYILFQQVDLETHGRCFVGGDRLQLRHFGKGFLHHAWIVGIERDKHPFFGNLTKTGQAGTHHAGFDGQQANVAFAGAVIEQQFGGAHGGAAGTGRQNTGAVVAEEQGVDQFGLAAGKLPHKRQRDFVVFQGLQRLFQLGFQLGILHIVIDQPATVTRQLAVDFLPPLKIGIHLTGKTR